MNLLDENFPDDQLPLLSEWRIPFRKIGREVSRRGVKDPDILPLLHKLRRVTFFTQDQGFFDSGLCHARYCLSWLDVAPDDAALFLRRFLKNPRFDSEAKRLGTVARAHHDGVEFWQSNRPALQRIRWTTQR